MFKPTPSLQKTLRRLPLSPKQAGKEYYKGNRVGSMGEIDKYGTFHANFDKIRTYVYPQVDIKTSSLTPFVAESIETTRQIDMDNYEPYPKRFTGHDYLRAWKLAGGYEKPPETGEHVGAANAYTNMPEVFEERPGAKS